MNRMLKWAGYGLAGVAATAVVVAGGAMAASQVMFRGPVVKPAVRMAAATDAQAAARGYRIATVHGCVDCHGGNLQGRMFDDIPHVARLYAPNLTLAVAKQSDADLDRAIRHGVRADGRPLWVMPSSTFAHLTDGETADLIAYLRTLRPAGAPQPQSQLGPVGRIGILIGQFKSEPTIIRAHENPALPDLGPQYAKGRDVARACVECHGPALKGGDGVLKTPDLTVAAAYDLPDFECLLRTGVAAGGREVGLMSASSRIRFGALTSDEITALHEYLKARAASVVAAAETKPLPKS